MHNEQTKERIIKIIGMIVELYKEIHNDEEKIEKTA